MGNVAKVRSVETKGRVFQRSVSFVGRSVAHTIQQLAQPNAPNPRVVYRTAVPTATVALVRGAVMRRVVEKNASPKVVMVVVAWNLFVGLLQAVNKPVSSLIPVVNLVERVVPAKVEVSAIHFRMALKGASQRHFSIYVALVDRRAVRFTQRRVE